MILKVVSYNIHRAIGLDRRFMPDRIIKILSVLNADVVLLQEVDEGVPRSKHLNLAQTIAEGCGYQHYALGHNVTLKQGHYGNATLSKFPIIKEHNIDLTVDKKKKRGCQHTTLQISSSKREIQRFEVFNLHLGLSARERQKQAAILFHSDQFQKIPLTTPCLVGGDFNDWRSMLRALFIAGRDFKCATDKITRNKEVAIKTYPSFSPRGGLDRIYYRGPMKLLNAYKSHIKETKVASDHLPVVASFHIG